MAACFGLRKKSVSKVEGYVLKREIGSGGFGVVLIGSRKSKKEKVAVKITDIGTPIDIDISEVSHNLIYLRHPHVIKQYKTIITPGYIIDIMECASQTDLGGYKVADRNEARMIFQQIISAVDYCHRKMVVHRDIKPDNILVDKNLNIKLVDFGLSAEMSDGKYLKGFCCTEKYRPPEVKKYTPYIGPEVDIYSCGVTLTDLWLRGAAKECGIKFTFGFEDSLLLNPVIRERFGDDPVMDLMNSMRADDLVQRATMDVIKNHPWFKQNLPNYLFPKKWNDQFDWININALDEIHKKYNVSIKDVYTALIDQSQISHFLRDYCLIIDNWRSDKLHAARPIHWEFRIGPPKKITEENIPVISRRGEVLSDDMSDQKDYKIQRDQASVFETEDKQMVFHRGLKFDFMTTLEEVLEILYSSLQTLNFEWKVLHDCEWIVRRKNDTSKTPLRMVLKLYRTGKRTYPYVIIMRSLPHFDSTDIPTVTRKYHNIMSFLEESSLLFCEFYHRTETNVSMQDEGSTLEWMK